MSGGRAAPTSSWDHRELVATLRSAIRGPVDDSLRRRAEYSSDASNYRVVPAVVVYPRDAADVLAVLEVARSMRVPLTMRGGGTSVAGNAIGPGIVLDTSRFFHRVVEIDPTERVAEVEPGVVVSDLQRVLARYGLRFGPDPATANRATIGGMLGNNACGAHALSFGRTADNVLELDVVDGTGRRFTAAAELDVVPKLATFVETNADTIRREFGRFSRQLSGYSLEHLLPENGRFLARALVGTEGTVVAVLSARLRLTDEVTHTALAVLGFPSLADAAEAVPVVLRHAPLAVEGLDPRLVDVVRRAGRRVPELPDAESWLLVEMGGNSPQHALSRARWVVHDVKPTNFSIITERAHAEAIWRIREDGAGLVTRYARTGTAWPGWEDAAVPPERLGSYLREFHQLLADFGIDAIVFGHFGDGCLHTRLDVPLANDADVDRFRAFVTAAADLVVAHGGSLSGEHGDGRARSVLLPRMYTPPAYRLLAEFKQLFDPEGILNPGVIVDAAPLESGLRRPAAFEVEAQGGFRFGSDAGSFTRAVHRCVGIAKCRADTRDRGGVMCPSYLATRDEKDSTRGRARVLQEMLIGLRPIEDGGPQPTVRNGFRSREIHESLDLCLSCKACSSECPAGVDMARYKSEVLFRAYRHRLRPRSHYLLGRLPAWLTVLRRIPRLASAALRFPPTAALIRLVGGIDGRRTLPPLDPRPARRRLPAAGGVATAAQAPPAQPVDHGPRTQLADQPVRSAVLWIDSFSDVFRPRAVQTTAALLADADYRVQIAAPRVCCALPWITTGQLAAARRRLTALVAALHPLLEPDAVLVCAEPSCAATLRSDLPDLLPDDPRAHAVAGAVRTPAQALLEAGWQPPRLDGVHVVTQPHCHQRAVFGYEADRALLESAGARVSEAPGCCGMAGNFGMEAGHFEISRRIAELGILAVLADAPGAVVVADGFSCHTQIHQLAGVSALHLTELFADSPSAHPAPPGESGARTR